MHRPWPEDDVLPGNMSRAYVACTGTYHHCIRARSYKVNGKWCNIKLSLHSQHCCAEHVQLLMLPTVRETLQACSPAVWHWQGQSAGPAHLHELLLLVQALLALLELPLDRQQLSLLGPRIRSAALRASAAAAPKLLLCAPVRNCVSVGMSIRRHGRCTALHGARCRALDKSHAAGDALARNGWASQLPIMPQLAAEVGVAAAAGAVWELPLRR